MRQLTDAALCPCRHARLQAPPAAGRAAQVSVCRAAANGLLLLPPLTCDTCNTDRGMTCENDMHAELSWGLIRGRQGLCRCCCLLTTQRQPRQLGSRTRGVLSTAARTLARHLQLQTSELSAKAKPRDTSPLANPQTRRKPARPALRSPAPAHMRAANSSRAAALLITLSAATLPAATTAAAAAPPVQGIAAAELDFLVDQAGGKTRLDLLKVIEAATYELYRTHPAFGSGRAVLGTSPEARSRMDDAVQLQIFSGIEDQSSEWYDVLNVSATVQAVRTQAVRAALQRPGHGGFTVGGCGASPAWLPAVWQRLAAGSVAACTWGSMLTQRTIEATFAAAVPSCCRIWRQL